MTKPRSGRVKSRAKPQKKSPSPQKKNYPTHTIPRSKLNAAIKFLEKKTPPKARNPMTDSCFKSILDKVGATQSRRVDSYMNDTANVLEVARNCALRGRWSDLMKTFAIQMESIRRYDLAAALRNALFAIIADPALNDPSFLEAYLYSNPYCTNQSDLKYCVDKILEVFQGVTIHTTKWKPAKENESETEIDESSGDSSSSDDD
ncbi:AAEL004429-PA [Aedes aegypti]|uniref:AAEL004429-PA n=1 Tax=Aedes aegypti TaxID=7159 RepID=Q17CS5_AEDAE|nr:AAEL004429-PA [Aedes aegypti]